MIAVLGAQSDYRSLPVVAMQSQGLFLIFGSIPKKLVMTQD